jgi:hypothetical protein
MDKETCHDEIVDLSKLTQKELLLQMYNSLSELTKRFDEFKNDVDTNENKNFERHHQLMHDVNDLRVRVSVNETKLRYFAALIGFVAGITGSIIIQIII